jgi:hypothetical protein
MARTMLARSGRLDHASWASCRNDCEIVRGKLAPALDAAPPSYALNIRGDSAGAPCTHLAIPMREKGLCRSTRGPRFHPQPSQVVCFDGWAKQAVAVVVVVVAEQLTRTDVVLGFKRQRVGSASCRGNIHMNTAPVCLLAAGWRHMQYNRVTVWATPGVFVQNTMTPREAELSRR